LILKPFNYLIGVIAMVLIFSHNTFAQNFPEMILVEGGSFTMGDMWEMEIPDEQPRHSVTVNSFSMAKTETTVAQWRAYCGTNGYSMPPAPPWGWNDTAPIVNVSWSDAVAYCNWLSNKTGQVYRLPTEAEWEYAAKGGSKKNKYKFAGFPSLNVSGWYSLNSDSHPHAVATKKPNELGLYDMCGNVSEWCSDWFRADYYSISPSLNPTGPETGTLRVARGGCWYFTGTYCTVAYRYNVEPNIQSFLIGFRVVSDK
jgi:sulfatase modifying factor 1